MDARCESVSKRILPSLKLTEFYTLSINGWKMNFLLGSPSLFSEGLGVETERVPGVETERAMSGPLLRQGVETERECAKNVTGVALWRGSKPNARGSKPNAGSISWWKFFDQQRQKRLDKSSPSWRDSAFSATLWHSATASICFPSQKQKGLRRQIHWMNVTWPDVNIDFTLAAACWFSVARWICFTDVAESSAICHQEQLMLSFQESYAVFHVLSKPLLIVSCQHNSHPYFNSPMYTGLMCVWWKHSLHDLVMSHGSGIIDVEATVGVLQKVWWTRVVEMLSQKIHVRELSKLSPITFLSIC